MTAKSLLNERYQLAADRFADLRIWLVPSPVRGSAHTLKYALAFVVRGKCVLRYDNEAGKGDHRHIGDIEAPYRFVSAQQLLDDFWKDVDHWPKD
jgi:Family of unknown function (DUF6516)